MPTVKELLKREPPPRAKNGFDVVGLGQNAVDYVVQLSTWPPRGGKLEASSLELYPGGQVATALVAASRLGLRTAYLGRVGNDDGGRFQLVDLDREGVDIRGVQVLSDVPSQFGVILVLPDGDRTILWGLDDRLVLYPEDLSRRRVCSARILHLDITGNDGAIQAARWARARGMWVSIDVDRRTPGDDELLALCDIVIAAEEVGPLDAPIAGVTLGEHGAYLRWPGGDALCRAFPVKAVDTTGCGDVFRGAFLAAALRDLDIRDALRFACAAAALKTRASGRDAIPTEREVQRLLKRRSRKTPPKSKVRARSQRASAGEKKKPRAKKRSRTKASRKK